MKIRTAASGAAAMAAAIILTSPIASGQDEANEQSIASPELDGEQPVIELDTFTVTGESDVGYVAVDSLAGGRINTPIRLTPSAMSSLTDEFLTDVAATDVRDALQWTINVVPADPTGGKSSPFNAWDYNFRGAGQNLQGGSGPTRNYFTFYQNADVYNLERLEFDRGPNAILFGVGTVGGVLSAYTKVPRIDDDLFAATVQLDEHGSLRLSFDGNLRLGESGAVRVNALRDRNEGWRDNDRNDTDAITLAFLYKPTSDTSIRLELEHSESERTIIGNTYGEAVSLWDGETVAETWGQELDTGDPQVEEGAPGARTMHPWGEPVYNLWAAGQPELGMQDWSLGYASTGTYLPVAPVAGFYPQGMQASWQPRPHPDTARIPILPDSEWNLSAADALSKPEFDVGTLWLQHRFSDAFEASVSAYRYEDYHLAQNYEGISFLAVDLNRQLPNGQANPNFGKRYGDFFASRQTQERTVSEIRAQGTYRVKSRVLEAPIEQIVTLSAAAQEIEWSARQYNAQVIDDDPDNWAQNMVWTRLYEDSPHARVALPTSINGQAVDYAPLPFDWFDFDEEYDLNNVALVSQTRLWDDRANVMLGARHDTYDYQRIGYHSRDESSHSADGLSYSAGAVYYFDWLGVFANYATNFDPIGPGRAPKLDGSAHEAAEGEGVDFGFRISTADKNYYATISRYESESEGRITGTKIGFSNIWQLYYDATGQTPVAERISLSYDDTESLEVNGYEFEVVANPVEGLRLQAGYAKPSSKIVEAMSGQRAYFAEHIGTWEAAAAGDSAAATDLRNQLQNARLLLDENAVGKTKVGLVDYTANAFVHYTFRDGWAQGFSIGGGVAMTGRRYIGEVAGEPRFSEEQTTTNLVLAYQTDFLNTRARFAINVDNLLDEDDYLGTSYDGGWTIDGQAIVNGYYFPPPRTTRFTATFEF